MTDPNASNHINLYPELDDELDAAYEQARAERPDIGVAAVAASVLGRIDHEMIAKLDELTEAQRTDFDLMMRDASYSVERIGLSMPTIEQFAGAGIDFVHLADGVETLVREGLGGTLIFAPLVSYGQWIDCFNQIRAEKEEDDGDADAAKIAEVPLPPDLESTIGDWVAYNKTDHDVIIDGTRWQVLAVADEEMPAYYDGGKYSVADTYVMQDYLRDGMELLGIQKTTDDELHITANVYLAHIAERLEYGIAPYWAQAWTRGTIDVTADQAMKHDILAGKAALWIGWDIENGCVKFGLENPQEEQLDVMLPVWGKP